MQGLVGGCFICDCKECARPVWKDLTWLVLSVAGVSILVVGATLLMGYLLGGYNDGA